MNDLIELILKHGEKLRKTKSGKPFTSDLSALAGRKVSAKERDEAYLVLFATFQPIPPLPRQPVEAIQQEVLDDLILVDSYRKDIAKTARNMDEVGAGIEKWMIDELNKQVREQEEVFLRFRTNVRKLLGFDE